MLCQKCGQAEATVHHTNIVNGVASESHLCAGCAGGHPLHAGFGTLHGLLSNLPNFGVPEIDEEVSALLKSLGSPPAPTMPNMAGMACPKCGATLLDLRKGKPGCPEDYSFFRDTLMGLIKAVHGGATRHVGKVPRNAPPEVKLSVLSAREEHLLRLQAIAVMKEEYEAAAKLRDELSSLREEMSALRGHLDCAD